MLILPPARNSIQVDPVLTCGTVFDPGTRDGARSAYRRDLNSGLIENRPTWSRMGKERRRAELLYTCEIHVNGRVVARTQGRRLPMSCPPHEGRLNRSSPYPPSRIRFEIDWAGSNSHGTPG